jgi:hypothetical protein
VLAQSLLVQVALVGLLAAVELLVLQSSVQVLGLPAALVLGAGALVVVWE